MKTLNNLSLCGNCSVLTPDEKAATLKKAAAEKAAAEKARLKRLKEEEAARIRREADKEKRRIAEERAKAEQMRKDVLYSKITKLEKAIAVLSKFHIGVVCVGSVVLFGAFWVAIGSTEGLVSYGYMWIGFISAHALIGLIQLICYISKKSSENAL